MSIDDRIAVLEKKVKDADRKDIWDIVSVVGGLLIPVAIFFAGQQYASSMAAAEIETSKSRDLGNRAIAEANARVSQANLLFTAIERLAGDDGPAKRVAIRAILYAIPAEGPRIVADLSRNDPSSQVRTYATDSLTQRKLALVAQLFAPDIGQRQDAYYVLVQNWRGDQTLPPLLIERVQQALANTGAPGWDDGIYNALLVLTNMTPEARAPSRDQLRALADRVRDVGPRVRAQADTLKGQLR